MSDSASLSTNVLSVNCNDAKCPCKKVKNPVKTVFVENVYGLLEHPKGDKRYDIICVRLSLTKEKGTPLSGAHAREFFRWEIAGEKHSETAKMLDEFVWRPIVKKYIKKESDKAAKKGEHAYVAFTCGFDEKGREIIEPRTYPESYLGESEEEMEEEEVDVDADEETNSEKEEPKSRDIHGKEEEEKPAEDVWESASGDLAPLGGDRSPPILNPEVSEERVISDEAEALIGSGPTISEFLEKEKTVIEEPKPEEPKPAEPMVEESKPEEPKPAEPMVEETLPEEPKAAEPVAKVPIPEEPKAAEPKAKEPQPEAEAPAERPKRARKETTKYGSEFVVGIPKVASKAPKETPKAVIAKPPVPLLKRRRVHSNE